MIPQKRPICLIGLAAKEPRRSLSEIDPISIACRGISPLRMFPDIESNI